MLILVAVPLAFQASWKLNRDLEGIEAKQEGTGLIEILLSGETNFSDQEMQTYHDHFWEAVWIPRSYAGALTLAQVLSPVKSPGQTLNELVV